MDCQRHYDGLPTPPSSDWTVFYALVSLTAFPVFPIFSLRLLTTIKFVLWSFQHFHTSLLILPDSIDLAAKHYIFNFPNANINGHIPPTNTSFLIGCMSQRAVTRTLEQEVGRKFKISGMNSSKNSQEQQICNESFSSVTYVRSRGAATELLRQLVKRPLRNSVATVIMVMAFEKGWIKSACGNFQKAQEGLNNRRTKQVSFPFRRPRTNWETIRS